MAHSQGRIYLQILPEKVQGRRRRQLSMEVEKGQEELLEFGGSLPVSSVQHPASTISNNIAERLQQAWNHSLEIPLVDLTKLLDQRFSPPEMDKLQRACQEWGFFQNLCIDSDKLKDVFKEGLLSVRVNYHPPCQEAEKILGLSPHSDAAGLTLLVKVSQCSIHSCAIHVSHIGNVLFTQMALLSINRGIV
ncbi:hypothetical protein ACLOJK_030317 [Asimina triloba]